MALRQWAAHGSVSSIQPQPLQTIALGGRGLLSAQLRVTDRWGAFEVQGSDYSGLGLLGPRALRCMPGSRVFWCRVLGSVIWVLGLCAESGVLGSRVLSHSEH